ncbi:IQ domain-containing protein H isoform X1 [Catharus ustulatus]|uniref:IQ domain-containing protein H isoform X1 n=1 Tax=Catharus ustulatus TaxID=91951 RepID=UPI00140BAAA2|nr:IQ domain-containing protein H isoform X1 [Catharus ustulatus]
MDFKVVLDPENTDNKPALKHPNEETRLPLITKKKSAPLCRQEPGKGPTVTKAWALPPFHCLAPPFPLAGAQIPKGALSLSGQRLILPAAQRALPAPPAVTRAAPLPELPRQQQEPAVGEVRLCPESTIPFPKPKEGISGTISSGKGSTAPLPSSNSMVSARKSKAQWRPPAQQLGSEVHIPSQTQRSQTAQPFQDPCLDRDTAAHPQTAQPFQDPCLDRDTAAHPQTAQPFQDPCLDRDTAAHQTAPAFLALQHHPHSSWGSTVEPTENLKDHTINSQKSAPITSEPHFNENPTKSAVLAVMKNQPAVEQLLNRAGQSSGGSAGAPAAPQRQQQQWAAGVICSAWRSWHHLARLRSALGAARRRHLENFHSRAKHLAANWNRIRTSRRTIIHIPSLAVPVLGSTRIFPTHREHIPDLGVQQNLQLGRLCDILDANVDVIYICPLALSEDLLHYYNKLLGLQAAVRSGNPEDMADLQDRFKILTPEAINSFPEHHLCLATVLRYSPRTMQRLQALLQGRDAYVVGGVPHLDDLAVADELQVPFLGSEPAVAQLYSTKSGSKRIFASAGVPTPPGEWDIHSREQLLRALSQLVLDHWEVQRWLFKVDGERGGDGTAFCDVISHLECQPWIQREWQGHPEVCRDSQARELALVKISQELPGLLAQHVQPVNEKRFPTWEKFLQTFLTQGGVIEAFPCSASVTNLTVDVLIEPTGEVTLLAAGDQLHAEGPLRSSGTSIPQRSVDPEVLQGLCWKIGEACKSRGVLGYFSVDFVAFSHPQTREQQVWATDLDLCYSDQLALTQLLLYMTDGNVDCGSSPLPGPLGSKESKNQRVQHEGTKPPALCAVASSQLRHSSLSGISYSVLLHTCQTRGLGFDLQEKQGTVFVLYEDQKRHSLGMVTIGEDLQGVLLTFARNLFIIHQEISAPNMQGETNFKMAIRDIEAILGVRAENKVRWEEEQAWEADALKE